MIINIVVNIGVRDVLQKKTTLRGNNSHVAKQPIMASLTNSKKGHDWLLGNVGIIPTLYRFFLEGIPKVARSRIPGNCSGSFSLFLSAYLIFVMGTTGDARVNIFCPV